MIHKNMSMDIWNINLKFKFVSEIATDSWD